MSYLVKFKSLSLKRRRKILLSAVIGLFILISLVLIIILTRADSIIFPSRVSGKITNQYNEPVDAAEVCIEANCTATDNEGNFLIVGLKYGNNDLKITAADHKQLSTSINLKRGENNLNFQLAPDGVGRATGTIGSEDEAPLNLNSLSVTIDNEPLTINPDGSFTTSSLSVGKHQLKITSSVYRYVIKEIDIIEGVNILEPINLESAAFISIQFVDWLTGAVIPSVTLTIDQNTFQSNRQGVILLEQLALDDYQLIASHSDYNDAEVTIAELEAGENQQLVFNMVNKGKVAYTSNRDGNSNIYISDFDGGNEKKLTSTGNNLNPRIIADRVYYYRSDPTEAIATQTRAFYYYKIESNETVTVIEEEFNPETEVNFAYNYYADVFVKQIEQQPNTENDWTYQAAIEISDLNGANAFNMFQLQNSNFYNYTISDSGKYLTVRLSDKDYYRRTPWEKGYYLLNLQNNSIAFLFPERDEEGIYTGYNISDVSADDKKILVEKGYGGYSYGSTDLWIYDVDTKNLSALTRSDTSEYDASFSPDGNHVAFNSYRDNKENIYVTNISGKDERKVSDVDYVYSYQWLHGELISFTTQEGLFIVNISNPENIRLITDQIDN